jgi:catechol 2,3-dioxygenase-like lactoylglutathione lyase family enzyme
MPDDTQPTHLPFAFEEVNHVCFTVSDLDATIAFWTHLLGKGPSSRHESSPTDATVTGYPGVRFSAAYFQLPGNLLLELFQYHNPETARPPSSETYVVGAAHVGLVVDDLDKSYRHLQGSGCTFRSEGPVNIEGGEHSGARTMYVRDRDGITIEILEFRD